MRLRAVKHDGLDLLATAQSSERVIEFTAQRGVTGTHRRIINRYDGKAIVDVHRNETHVSLQWENNVS